MLVFIIISHDNYSFFLQIMHDVDSGGSKGFAFVNFASFDVSDAAIEAMNGQCISRQQTAVVTTDSSYNRQ